MTNERPRSPVDRRQVEVAGRSIMALLGGMKFLEMRARRILEQSGIQNLKVDGWYPMESLLAAFDAVAQRIGPNTLREIGKDIPRNATFPTDIDSLEKALRSIDVAYRMNHRGTGDIGGYRVLDMEPRRARMLCDNPYPCDMDMGLIETMADQFRPKGAPWVKLAHQGLECRKEGARACTYVVTW